MMPRAESSMAVPLTSVTDCITGTASCGRMAATALPGAEFGCKATSLIMTAVPPERTAAGQPAVSTAIIPLTTPYAGSTLWYKMAHGDRYWGHTQKDAWDVRLGAMQVTTPTTTNRQTGPLRALAGAEQVPTGSVVMAVVLAKGKNLEQHAGP